MELSSTLQDWINPLYLKLYQQNKLRSFYLQKMPFEHIVLDNFLTQVAHEKLVTIAEAAPKQKNTSRAGLSNDRDINWGYIDDSTTIKLLFGTELRSFVSHMSGETAHIKKGSYPQLTEFCAGTKGFSIHNDEYEDFDWVFLLYLQNTHTTSSAGSFRMYEKETETYLAVKDIIAYPNRLLCFKVGHGSYHSVEDLLPKQRRLNLTLDWVLPNSNRAQARSLEQNPKKQLHLDSFETSATKV